MYKELNVRHRNIIIITMLVVHVREGKRGGRWRGSMEQFQGSRGMPTAGEWCNPISNMLHHVYKGLSGDLARDV